MKDEQETLAVRKDAEMETGQLYSDLEDTHSQRDVRESQTCPTRVRNEAVGPQQVQLTGGLEAGLVVDTPEGRHQEGEQRGARRLYVQQVLIPSAAGGGGRARLRL